MRFSSVALVYENYSVFLNESEVAFASRAEELREVDCRCPYISHHARFLGEWGVLIDFMGFLEKVYAIHAPKNQPGTKAEKKEAGPSKYKKEKQETRPAQNHTLLVLSLEGLQKPHRQKAQQMIAEMPQKASRAYVAFSCGVVPGSLELDASQIRILQGDLFSCLYQKGMLGFVEPPHASTSHSGFRLGSRSISVRNQDRGYFLDLENTFIYGILGER